MHILDRALAGHDSEDLEFAFEYDDLHPPHPFAELLRRAFAPKLDPTVLLISTLAAEVDDKDWPLQFESAQHEWHTAIMRFAERYGIWNPESCWRMYRSGSAALAPKH